MEIPIETFGVFSQFLTLKDVLSLATTNKEFRDVFLLPQINKQLADYFGFPYGLTLVESKKYERMSYNKRLIAAAIIGDMRILKKMIEFGANFFANAFYEAVMYNQDEVMKYLNDVAKINFGNVIYHAAYNSNLEAVKKIQRYHRDSIHNDLSNTSDDFIQALKEAIAIKMAYYGDTDKDKDNIDRDIISLHAKELKEIFHAKGIDYDFADEIAEADSLGMNEFIQLFQRLA